MKVKTKYKEGKNRKHQQKANFLNRLENWQTVSYTDQEIREKAQIIKMRNDRDYTDLREIK